MNEIVIGIMKKAQFKFRKDGVVHPEEYLNSLLANMKLLSIMVSIRKQRKQKGFNHIQLSAWHFKFNLSRRIFASNVYSPEMH